MNYTYKSGILVCLRHQGQWALMWQNQKGPDGVLTTYSETFDAGNHLFSALLGGIYCVDCS